MKTGWWSALAMSALVGCDQAGTLPGETDTAESKDTSVAADTSVAQDTFGDDTSVPADTTVAEDTSVPADTTVAEDTSVPADTTVADDTTVVDPEIPVPGGTITFSAPPSGFSANKPAWVTAGPCSSGQWWTYEGTHESKSMHPGRDCIDCHNDHDGPSIRYAGTVYAAVDDSDECRGVQGVTVEILRGTDDSVAATTVTGAGGNFYWRSTAVANLGEYRARLTYQGRTREMDGTQTNGDCNTCHGSVGTEDAPGRIVAP